MTNVETKKNENTRPAEEARAIPVYAPNTDIYETLDAMIVVADMPGVDEKHVEVQLENDVLTLTGRSIPEDNHNLESSYREYSAADYQRSFTLSEDIERENIKARIKDGVLRVTLPKTKKNRTMEIPVESGESPEGRC